MKNPLFLLMMPGLLLIGCKQGQAPAPDEGPDMVSLPKTDVDSVQVMLDGNYCYRYMMHRDTYDIHLTLVQGRVTGEMNFDNYEGESSNGSLDGYIKEDIITLKYRHNTDGITKVSEMYFKVRGNLLITAEGEEKMEGDSTFFSDPAGLRYEGLVYSKIECP